MTDIEERLSAILLAEADRHETPVFDARGVAESAVRKGFWRRRPVVLLAAVGLAGATGVTGAVVAAGGHEHHDRVTVTFTREDNPYLPDSTPFPEGPLESWVRARARAEGLKDIEVTVRQNPPAFVVSGRAADLPRLRLLRLEGDVWMMQAQKTGSPYSTAPRLSPSQCVQAQEIGPPTQVCDEYGSPYTFASSAGSDLHVVAAHAEHRRPGPGGWAVVGELDAGSAEHYRSFTAAMAMTHERMQVVLDGFVLAQPVLAQPDQTGVVESEAVFTEQQAKDLAVILTTPRTFRQLGPTTVTVEAGDHVAG